MGRGYGAPAPNGLHDIAIVGTDIDFEGSGEILARRRGAGARTRTFETDPTYGDISDEETLRSCPLLTSSNVIDRKPGKWH